MVSVRTLRSHRLQLPKNVLLRDQGSFPLFLPYFCLLPVPGSNSKGEPLPLSPFFFFFCLCDLLTAVVFPSLTHTTKPFGCHLLCCYLADLIGWLFRTKLNWKVSLAGQSSGRKPYPDSAESGRPAGSFPRASVIQSPGRPLESNYLWKYERMEKMVFLELLSWRVLYT